MTAFPAATVSARPVARRAAHSRECIGADEHASAEERAEMMENLRTLMPLLAVRNRDASFTRGNLFALRMLVRLIGSERSAKIFRRTEDKLAATLPGVRRITLEGVSHFFARGEPTAFNPALLDDLAGR